ncbi:MAG: hypothetical protein DMF75_12375 [Acidobacteria bacterium]|nr:MAG: hypothetical protein DMF75_12375 [Acidobacteriota bacterium]
MLGREVARLRNAPHPRARFRVNGLCRTCRPSRKHINARKAQRKEGDPMVRPPENGVGAIIRAAEVDLA